MLIIFVSLNQIYRPHSSPSCQNPLSYVIKEGTLSLISVLDEFQMLHKTWNLWGGKRLYLQSTLDTTDTLTAQVQGHSPGRSELQGFLAICFLGMPPWPPKITAPGNLQIAEPTSLPLPPAVICPMTHQSQGDNPNISKNLNIFFSEEWPVFCLSQYICFKETKV